MKTPIIITERLILREVKKDDVNDIFTCWMRDEDVSRYMYWKASNDISKVEEFVQFELEQIDNDKWNRWIIISKDTDEMLGTCLVFWNEDDLTPHWDVSYNLGKKYWGKGYITEAMFEVMKYAESSLHMKECITSYAKVNEASANLLHKLGFVEEKEISYECSGGEIVTDGIQCRYTAKTTSEENIK